jgi:hypothetical protein
MQMPLEELSILRAKQARRQREAYAAMSPGKRETTLEKSRQRNVGRNYAEEKAQRRAQKATSSP